MTTQLVKILEKALIFADIRDRWFNRYEEDNSQTAWKACLRYYERAHGLLDAYEILTGKKVYCLSCKIREELETL